MKNKIITTPCGQISWLVPNQIVKELYLTPANLNDTKKHNRLLLEHFSVQNRGILSLVDIRKLRKNPSKEVRDYFVSEEVTQWHLAVAIYVNSGFTRALGNFYLQLKAPKYPTVLFSNEQKAQAWLSSFL